MTFEINMLSVGLNRYACGQNLSGCIRDVDMMNVLLSGLYGVRTTMVKDEKATTDAFKAALLDLRAKDKPGCYIVLDYSGHGSQVPDTDGDETDGLDECFCPYDFDRNHCITDDFIRKTFSDIKGRMVIFADSCHSDTMDRGVFKPRRILSGYKGRPRGPLPPCPNITLFSGCASDQTSADAVIKGKPNGAFTYYLMEAIKSLPHASMQDIQNRLFINIKKNGYTQSPHLSTTRAHERLFERFA